MGNGVSRDNPEWTADDFRKSTSLDEAAKQRPELAGVARAARRRPGRPPADKPKQQVTLRLSPEVIEHFKAGGPGWQTRIDETLKRSIRR